MSELQDLFEQCNPIPKGITRCGDHYAQTEYMLIDPYASNYAARFKGFMEGVKHQQAIIDNLKTQLNNMEQCYIQLKQEHNELIKHDTRVDRKWKSAEKTAEKYKSKVLMIADLLRDSTDQDMTLKAIKTVIDRVGEHG